MTEKQAEGLFGLVVVLTFILGFIELALVTG